MINVTLGETFVLRLDATDADGDPLTFDVPNLPPGATFNSTDNILYFSWNVISADEVLMYFFLIFSTLCLTVGTLICFDSCRFYFFLYFTIESGFFSMHFVHRGIMLHKSIQWGLKFFIGNKIIILEGLVDRKVNTHH